MNYSSSHWVYVFGFFALFIGACLCYCCFLYFSHISTTVTCISLFFCFCSSPLFLYHLPISYSIRFLLVGIVFVFVSLMCEGGLRVFKNAVNATGRVSSSWVNVMEVCVSWIGISCKRGHDLMSSSHSFLFFWRIVKFFNVSCKCPFA